MAVDSLDSADVSRNATKLAELVVLGKLPDAKKLVEEASAEERAAILDRFKDYDDKASLEVKRLITSKLVAPAKPEITPADAEALKTSQVQSLPVTVTSDKLNTLSAPPRPIDLGEIRGDTVVFKAEATATAADSPVVMKSEQVFSVTVTDKMPPEKGPSIFSRIGGVLAGAASLFLTILRPAENAVASQQNSAQPTETVNEAKPTASQKVEVKKAGADVKAAYFLPPQSVISFAVEAASSAAEIIQQEAKKPLVTAEDLRAEIARISAGASSNLDPMQLDALSGELNKLSATSAGDQKLMAAIKDAKLRIEELRRSQVKS